MLAAAMDKNRPSPRIFARVRQGMRSEPVPIDEQVFGLHGQTVDGPVHREVGGLEDVDAFDFLDGRPPHRPGLRLGFNAFPQRLPGLGANRFLLSSRPIFSHFSP